MPLAAGQGGVRFLAAVTRKSFRRLFQPFINETLDRQRHFNDAVYDLSGEVFARLEELEREVRALRRDAGRGAGTGDPAERPPGTVP